MGKKNVPEAKITLAENKSLVYGKVLIDDYPKYIDGWLETRPRQLVIMPAQIWNKEYSHPQAIRYDGTNLKEIKNALLRAQLRKPNEPLDLSKI